VTLLGYHSSIETARYSQALVYLRTHLSSERRSHAKYDVPLNPTFCAIAVFASSLGIHRTLHFLRTSSGLSSCSSSSTSMPFFEIPYFSIR
jgi:hypothetical protein